MDLRVARALAYGRTSTVNAGSASAAEAFGAAVITAAAAPAINSGAIKRALMFIVELPIL